jgi:PAS domain S-box-containing protein
MKKTKKPQAPISKKTREKRTKSRIKTHASSKRKSAHSMSIKQRLYEAEEALRAIRCGEVDGLIVSSSNGHQVFTLQTAEHPYRVLVEEMNEGAFTLFGEDIISYSNKPFAEMIGVPLEKVIGASIHSLVDPSSATKLKALIRTAWIKMSAKGEIGFTCSKSTVPTYLSASFIDQSGIPSLCVVVTNLTDQKRNERILRAEEARDRELERLQMERRIAETANQSKSNFLANMSHEIRTPLGAILGFAQLMNDPHQTPEDRADCVSTILRNGDQLARVINEILDLSKIESDRMEIEKIEFSLPELIEDVLSLLNLQAQEKGLRLSVSYQGVAPRYICSDPTRLRQILFNVIGNAIKFTDRGSVDLEIVMAPYDYDAKNRIQMTVTDTGSGLNPDQQARLFKPFVQADSTTTRKYGGTGLGLALSKKLAQALGGDLTIKKSEPGIGSSFLITIDAGSFIYGNPQSRLLNASGALLKGPRESMDSSQVLEGSNILLIDDAPDNRVLVGRFLKIAGAKVDCAENGQEGVEKALSGNYDLLLLDIQMPIMDGFAAVRALREHDFKKPIVALTAHAMKGDRERCIQAGFNDYLVKPVDRAHLIRTVAELQRI